MPPRPPVLSGSTSDPATDIEPIDDSAYDGQVAPVRRQSDALVKEILDGIRSGKLKPGRILPTEKELSEQHQVSRTVVREAMQLLKARGLVHARRGSGTFIAHIRNDHIAESLDLMGHQANSIDAWQDLVELRSLIEADCARRLAATPDENIFARMREALDEMRDNDSALDGFINADIAFHTALVASSGNRLLQTVHASLLPMTRKFAAVTYNPAKMHPAELAEHEALLAAIRAGNPAHAARRMQRHLERAMNQMRRIFADQL